MVPFRDRAHAGQVLAGRLAPFAGRPDPLVLALPRGGVPVAYEVASALNAPLDVFIVRKLGVPWRPELAMGAIASGGARVLNTDVIFSLGITDRQIELQAQAELRELARRETAYRGDRPPPAVKDRTVILVDDGLATGSTMRVALQALRAQNPRELIAAVPIASPDVCAELADAADEMICTVTPEPLYAVGLWYANFAPTTDEEVRMLLQRAAERPLPRAA
jgi:putative phosphoribosyl transferase